MLEQLSLGSPSLGRLRCACGRTPSVWWERRATPEEVSSGVAVVTREVPTVRFCALCARDHVVAGGKVSQCAG